MCSQVSPAKLALRRHLSQEKLAAASAQQIQQLDEKGGLGYVATRSIGDLVSGEIERTLEISNQHIINVAIDMSPILNVSGPNSNVPQRPERVNARLNDIAKKEDDRVAGTPSPLLRTVYSPISRPSSAEVGNPPTPTSNVIHPPTTLEGLAYPHRSKSPGTHHNLSTLAHVAFGQQNCVPPPIFSPRGGSAYPPANYPPRQQSQCRYSPVQLPRADMKPYHESYFMDAKDFKPVPNKSFPNSQHGFAPVEGLAATLHDRIVNDGARLPSPNQVKEENDGPRSNCMLYENNYNSNQRTMDKRQDGRKCALDAHYSDVQDKKHLAVQRSSVLSSSVIQNAVVKTEVKDRNYSNGRNNMDFNNMDKKLMGQKRASPVIHGPIRPVKKPHVTEADTDISSVVNNASQPLAISAISSPENNSGKSTPYNEDDRRQHEEGKFFLPNFQKKLI